MKATELRIGNYWKSKFDKATYELTYELLAEQFNGVDLGFEDMKPIPLTEEWLKKFGFYILHETNDTKIYWKGERQRINVSNKMFFYKVYNGTKQIKHVHQLQNLYFALTGEELKKNIK